jgi:hypothetical protein
MFEIQARLWHQSCWGTNSLHCALAAREDYDLVIVDMCDGKGTTVTKRFLSPPSLAPTVLVTGSGSGSTYEVSSFDNISGRGINLTHTCK